MGGNVRVKRDQPCLTNFPFDSTVRSRLLAMSAVALCRVVKKTGNVKVHITNDEDGSAWPP